MYDLGPISPTIYPEFTPMVTKKQSTVESQENVHKPETIQPTQCQVKTPKENFRATSVSMTAKSSAKIVEKSVSGKHDVEAVFLEKGSCTTSAPQLTTDNESKSKTQETGKKPGKKLQFKSKGVKKSPLLWKTFPEPGTEVDLTFFTDNLENDGSSLPEKLGHQAPSRKYTFWKTSPESEPELGIIFFADIEMRAREGD